MKSPPCIYALLLLIACGGDTGTPHYDAAPPLEDVLTLELTFGDDDSLGEYLLAQPRYGLAVARNNDILVPDENRIKVFDPQGNPKTLLGGTGQGPGEFKELRYIYINQRDEIYGLDFPRIPSAFNSYTLNYEFMHKTRLETSNIREYFERKPEYLQGRVSIGLYSASVAPISNGEFVYQVDGYRNSNMNRTDTWDLLVYEKGDSLKIIAEFQNSAFIWGEISAIAVDQYGGLHWKVLPDGRIAYIDSWHMCTFAPDYSYYTLHIASPDDMNETVISHVFTPVSIPDSEINSVYANENNEEYKKDGEIIKEKLRERKYYGCGIDILIDDNFLFFVTNYRNDQGEYLLDIFNIESGEYVRSAYFSMKPKAIRNGYAYRFNDWYALETFPHIEKYRIDPAVYGK